MMRAGSAARDVAVVLGFVVAEIGLYLLHPGAAVVGLGATVIFVGARWR